MEEADALADSIGIMIRGELRALGRKRQQLSFLSAFSTVVSSTNPVPFTPEDPVSMQRASLSSPSMARAIS